MCEDRGLQVKRSVTNRLDRIHQARHRFRAVRRTLPLDPAQNAQTPVEYPSVDIQQNHIPVPLEAATADVNVNVRRLQRFNMHTKPDERLIPNYQMPRGNLVEIAMRTVMLMRQNQQLQQRLAALRAETKMFMQSVMNNPENNLAAQNPPPLVNPSNEIPKVKIEPEDVNEPVTLKIENDD